MMRKPRRSASDAGILDPEVLAEWNALTPAAAAAGFSRLQSWWNNRHFSIGWPAIGTLTIDVDALYSAIRAKLANDAVAEARCRRILTELQEASAGFLHVRSGENTVARRRTLRRFTNAVADFCSYGLAINEAHRPSQTDWPSVFRDLPRARQVAAEFYSLKAEHNSPIVAWATFAARWPESAAHAEMVHQQWCDGSWPRSVDVLAHQLVCTLHAVRLSTFARRLRERRQKS